MPLKIENRYSFVNLLNISWQCNEGGKKAGKERVGRREGRAEGGQRREKEGIMLKRKAPT